MIKYKVKYSNSFKKQLKKLTKQGKDINKLLKVVEILSSGENLDVKFKDHQLIDNKYFKKCRECHIEPDWLLVYKVSDDEIILFLVETGSHSELFGK